MRKDRKIKSRWTFGLTDPIIADVPEIIQKEDGNVIYLEVYNKTYSEIHYMQANCISVFMFLRWEIMIVPVKWFTM